LSKALDASRKNYLHGVAWTQRKDGVPLHILDDLSPSERSVAEEELIGALSLNDDWPVQGLAHIRSRKALPRLKELLSESRGRMKIIIAHALYRISGDPAMVPLVSAELAEIRNNYELIEILYLLPGFGDEMINGQLRAYLEHPEYLVAYNAARALGLNTDEVVRRFRGLGGVTPMSAATPVASAKPVAPRSTPLESSPANTGSQDIPTGEKKTTEAKLRLASMILFGISLALPAYCTGSTCSHSLLVFLLGGLGLLGGHGWSWLANPLLFVSWGTLRRSPRLSMMLSTLAFLFAGLFMLGGSVPVNENGGVQSVTALKAGYWCWLLSNGLMMMGAMSKVYRLNLVLRTERLARGEASKFN